MISFDKRHVVWWCLACLLLPITALAQFGQNKVQYEYLHWESIRTPHFEIYFPDGGYDIATATADFAELAYRHLSRNLAYELEADDRITIITHRSHNQFQETNVSTEQPDESTGGFTEYFKSRVVIPYEGNWEKYRHVVHHELTHAIMLRKYFGHGLQSVVNGISRMPLPLWYVEGLAEYQSRFGWDIEADMFLRDAVVNDWLPPLDQLGGYLNYKGGQSIFYYLDRKYGKDKLTEFVNRVPRYRDFDRGVRASLGIDAKDLSERWSKWIKGEMWKSAEGREATREFATPLTDHKKLENYVNNAPAISPQGDRIAFLSDRSDYFDIWLLNAYDGKVIRRLVSGERNSGFEELHWLQSGITWDPEGNLIAFGAKADGKDALYIVDSRTAKITRKFIFPLDGVYGPSWSPDGKQLAFQGWRNGKCDLYLVDIASEKLSQLTNDVYTDFEPSWSPDGRSLLFTSDRGDSVNTRDTSYSRSAIRLPKQTYEIYQYDFAANSVKRITTNNEISRTPVFVPKDSAFIYVNNKSGIFNLYYFDMRTGESKALTNTVTGVFQPSISSSKAISFAAFDNGGYDIFWMPSPLSSPKWKNPKPTPLKATNPRYPQDPALSPGKEKVTLEKENPYANYVFDDLNPVRRTKPLIADKPEAEPKPAVTEATTDSSTNFIAEKYRVKMSPDFLFASAGFSSLSGFQGMGQFLISDVLGNHVVFIATDLYYDIENTNINAMYYYLAHRADVGIGGFHNVYFFNYGWTRDRSYGATFESQYPISKYLRVDFSTNFINIQRSRYTYDKNDYVTLATRHVLMPMISLVKDNSIWGGTGPANGERWYVSLSYSPDFDKKDPANSSQKWGLDFRTATFDYRRYMRVNRDYWFALRASGGVSEGKSPQRFFLGGEANTLNRLLKNSAFVNDIDNVFFSSTATPLRGYDVYEFAGTRYALTNVEFRYPLIRWIALGFPLPAFFYNIRGASFIDAGGVWDKDNFRGAVVKESGSTQLLDLKFGYGCGARVNLGIAYLKYDIAWRTDWMKNDRPQHYLTLGTEF